MSGDLYESEGSFKGWGYESISEKRSAIERILDDSGTSKYTADASLVKIVGKAYDAGYKNGYEYKSMNPGSL